MESLDQLTQVLGLAVKGGAAVALCFLIWALVQITRSHDKAMSEIVKSFTSRAGRSEASNGKAHKD